VTNDLKDLIKDLVGKINESDIASRFLFIVIIYRTAVLKSLNMIAYNLPNVL